MGLYHLWLEADWEKHDQKSLLWGLKRDCKPGASESLAAWIDQTMKNQTIDGGNKYFSEENRA